MAEGWETEGRWKGGLDLYQAVLVGMRQGLGEGEDTVETQRTMSRVVLTLHQQDRYDESLPLAEELVELSQRQFGEHDPNNWNAMKDLATNALFSSSGENGEKCKLWKDIAGGGGVSVDRGGWKARCRILTLF